MSEQQAGPADAGMAYETETPPPSKASGASPVSGLAQVVRVALYIAGGGLAAYGGSLGDVVDSAIHQIYQLMAITGGLTLVAACGVWGAVDGVRAAITR